MVPAHRVGSCRAVEPAGQRSKQEGRECDAPGQIVASCFSIPSSLESGWEEAGGGDPRLRLAWQVREGEIRERGRGGRREDSGRSTRSMDWFGGS